MGTGKSKLEIREYDQKVDTPENVTAVIFVRHGTSWANLRKETGKKDYHSILDPGLTRKGIFDAREQGKKFRGKLKSNYGDITPIVCASVLLRAQMTAYMMMNPNLNKEYDIRILPYISEVIYPIITMDDNKPRNFKEQKQMLDSLGLTEFKNMKRIGYTGYKDDKQSDMITPNFTLFTRQLKGELCRKNKDENRIRSVPPTTRCSVKNKMVNISERDTRTNYAPIIIVTHGQTISNFLKEMGSPIDKSDRPNFSAFRVYFNHETKDFIKNPIDSNDAIKNPKNPKRQSYSYPYDNELRDDVNVVKECEWENAYPACESDVCDPSASVTSTMHIGGRTRKRVHALLKTGQRVRRKSRKRTQKNS